MKKLIFVLLLINLFGASYISPAQKADGSDPVQWQRYRSEDGEFSIEMPSNPVYFYDKTGITISPPNKTISFSEMQLLNSAVDGTCMSVTIYRAAKPKSNMKDLMENEDLDGDKTDEKVTGFTVKQVEQTSFQAYQSKEKTPISFITRYIASQTHIYVVTVANRNGRSDASKRFLSSLRLTGGTNTSDSSVSINSLKPLGIDDLAFDESNIPQASPFKPQEPDGSIKKTPLVILRKVRATYTEGARKDGVNGMIRLRCTFGANGGIVKVVLLRALPHGLNRNAFFSILRMVFLPQETDGVPVVTTKVIEYQFALY